MKPGRLYWQAEYRPMYDQWEVISQVLTPSGEWLYAFSPFNEKQKADTSYVADTLSEMQRSLLARANPYLESNDG